VFCSKEEAEANSAITRLSPQDGTDKRFFVSVVVGQAVSWDGIPWQIVNVGASKIGLLASDGSLVFGDN
jgi:hypothetical protein